MLRHKTLKDIYAIFLTEHGNPFEHHNILDIIKREDKSYQNQILKFLETAIADQNVNKLRFCLEAAVRDGLDEAYAESFHKLLLATWHQAHQDLVAAVCFLKDESFCEALFEIAIHKFPYRPYDGADEATLRRCVYAFKSMGTAKADSFLAQLLATNNPNVALALATYDDTYPCGNAYSA